MQRESIQSSCIESVGYDPDHRALEVEFRRGGVYAYFGVPLELVRRMAASASIGRFFAEQIRPRFACRRVE